VIFALLLNANAAPAIQASAQSAAQEVIKAAPRAAGFVVEVDNGHKLCRPATREESRAMRRRDPNLELRAISPGEGAGASLLNQSEQAQTGGLKIVLRGTPQLDSYPQAKAAFLRAAKQWEILISSPITVVIDVDYGPTRFGETWGATTLGSTQDQDIGG